MRDDDTRLPDRIRWNTDRLVGNRITLPALVVLFVGLGITWLTTAVCGRDSMPIMPTPTEDAPPTAGPTARGADCILADGGVIEGALTVDGAPAPDGVEIALIFAGGGGLSETAYSRDGHYAFTMLKRVCEDGTFYVPFTMYAGQSTATVRATSDHEILDFDAISPPEPPAERRECALQFGRLNGRVPGSSDPTLMTVTSVPGTGNLTQQVLAVDGRYEVTTTGWRCMNGQAAFLPLVVTSERGSVEITPQGPDVQADIVP